MIANIFHNGRTFQVDLYKPIDISIPLSSKKDCVNAWYVDPMKIEPVRMDNWIGDVKLGGNVNFKNITFNPHGNGTHTECVGHISKEDFSINKTFSRFMFLAELVSILPDKLPNGDQVITRKHFVNALKEAENTEAIVIRTLSNDANKVHKQYSNTNPPFILKDAIEYLNEKGIEHLLIDLPSVDKEKDDGKLEAHHAFWNYPANTQTQKSITEMIFVPNEIMDGNYLLNIQIASFENDASPSKPVLYKIY